jgi:hypothetical protein
VTSLRGTPQPFKLEVDEAEIVRAQGNMRSEAKHGVPGGCDQRYLDRSGVNPRDCAFKGLVGNPARLESYEGSSKVVSPISKGLIRTSRLGRPFHEHPNKVQLQRVRQVEDIASGNDGQISLIAAFSSKFLAGSAPAPGPCSIINR